MACSISPASSEGVVTEFTMYPASDAVVSMPTATALRE